MTQETIYALATARGKAGVAVIRISGPDARAGALLHVHDLPPARQAGLRVFRDGGEEIDRLLILWFEQGHSFTGEEVVELHCHGSQAIIQSVLSCLGRIERFRLADAGEFTKRALENGCLDLTQVEGLADLIDAETEAQRRQAMRVFSGALGAKCDGWRRDLLRAAALVEATIDFADEEVPEDVWPEVLDLVRSVLHSLREERRGFGAAERVRDGFEVAILGLPNAGKSTLINRLAGRPAALTSEFAGTTRDVIEVRMDIGGLAVTFLDTAGLREAEDPVEAMGIAVARSRAMDADLRIFLVGSEGELYPEEMPGDIRVLSKDDEGLRGVSGRTGAGLDALVAEVSSRLSERASSASTITRIRHREAVMRAIEALELSESLILEAHPGEEVVAESLREATRVLDVLVGRIGTEDLLGEIFASFCIGK